MEGFKPAAIVQELTLDKKELFPVLLLPIGYRSTDDQNQYLPKVRKPINEYTLTI